MEIKVVAVAEVPILRRKNKKRKIRIKKQKNQK